MQKGFTATALITVAAAWLLAGFIIGALWQAWKIEEDATLAPRCKLVIPDHSFLPEDYYWHSITSHPDGLCVN